MFHILAYGLSLGLSHSPPNARRCRRKAMANFWSAYSKRRHIFRGVIPSMKTKHQSSKVGWSNSPLPGRASNKFHKTSRLGCFEQPITLATYSERAFRDYTKRRSSLHGNQYFLKSETRKRKVSNLIEYGRLGI